eukprot:TRINITY_DN4804_c0_g3_i7.p2 TRINITY_DN4804_c0_g3~~TRINITY_DN4804_c0_g3_i7.p2  ORF type:complete len:117 (-),score=12.66 TRINITY_DN4804_c0_g3_i7:161-511(-)
MEGGIRKLANVLERWLKEIYLQDVIIKHIKRSKNVKADYISRNISYISIGDMDLVKYVYEEVTGHESLLYVVEYIKDIRMYNPNKSEQFLEVICIDDIHIDRQIILINNRAAGLLV